MTDKTPDVVVLRKNTEGLSTADYTDVIREKLPNHHVVHAKTPHQERTLIKQAPVATGVTLTKNLLDHADNLRMFVAASSGYNHLPIERMNEQGIVLANAAGIHAPGIAEQALGYCLTFARQIHEGWERKNNEEWRHYKADEFAGSTVTVVGMGSIGTEFVDRLESMGVHTIGVRYTPEKGGPTDEVTGFDERDLHDALSRTDYLVLSTPLTDTTRKLIGESELNTLPPSAYVINVCRGGVLDTDALLSAIQNEDIGGAAMDVTDPEPLPPDHPLWRMGNVIITPHMGGHTPKHWDRLADILANNVYRLQTGEVDGFHNQVNEPVELTNSAAMKTDND